MPASKNDRYSWGLIQDLVKKATGENLATKWIGQRSRVRTLSSLQQPSCCPFRVGNWEVWINYRPSQQRCQSASRVQGAPDIPTNKTRSWTSYYLRCGSNWIKLSIAPLATWASDYTRISDPCVSKACLFYSSFYCSIMLPCCDFVSMLHLSKIAGFFSIEERVNFPGDY